MLRFGVAKVLATAFVSSVSTSFLDAPLERISAQATWTALIKSFIRWRAVNGPHVNRDLCAHVFLWPFASLLYFYNTIVAGFSRRIKWRGITYELKSPSEAVIISREPA